RSRPRPAPAAEQPRSLPSRRRARPGRSRPAARHVPTAPVTPPAELHPTQAAARSQSAPHAPAHSSALRLWLPDRSSLSPPSQLPPLHPQRAVGPLGDEIVSSVYLIERPDSRTVSIKQDGVAAVERGLGRAWAYAGRGEP